MFGGYSRAVLALPNLLLALLVVLLVWDMGRSLFGTALSWLAPLSAPC